MKVVILAGGYGTRLSEETGELPKPMIEIGGRPLLWHLMKSYSHQGFQEFVVALGYKGEIIERYFQIDRHKHAVPRDWKIELVDTGQDTMTGGRLRRLRDRLDETFFFTYGDGLSTVDFLRSLEFHRSHGKLATVTAVQPPSKFGVLHLDGIEVSCFNEKPAASSTFINGGFFILEPGAIDRIEDDATSWEREPCETLARDGQMSAYRHDGFWQCVDTLHELRLLRNAWNNGEAAWKTWN